MDTLLGAARYDILCLVGAGRMSEVFLAHDRASGGEVCVKRLRFGVHRRELEQELAAIKRLEHPYLVRLLDHFEDNGRLHLVVEYVRGDTLDVYLRSHGPLLEATALDLCAQILEAIAYAHERRVIHRDLSPSKLLLEPRGGALGARVLDVGIAIVDDVDENGDRMREGMIVGTPYYTAPELFMGAEVSPAADLYALGIILAEMLLGHHPFEDVGVVSMLLTWKLRQDDGIDVSEIPALPATRALIGALTCGNPARRLPAPEALMRLREQLSNRDGR